MHVEFSCGTVAIIIVHKTLALLFDPACEFRITAPIGIHRCETIENGVESVQAL